MTKDLITVYENDVMSKVEDLMKQHNINHVPVVDHQFNLKGILTKNDIQLLKDWGTELQLKTAIKANKQILNSQTASDRMNRILLKVEPDDTLGICADIFKENMFHALPVVDGDKLVGIVTTYDLINAAYSKKTLLTEN